ncbi:MAG: hypothetical protein HOG08_01880 [Candidatus Magasanikbacteria bacterium]|nr:hypothetical protein [Candidatus Magasanikbacteria bacterium]
MFCICFYIGSFGWWVAWGFVIYGLDKDDIICLYIELFVDVDAALLRLYNNQKNLIPFSNH